MKSSPAAGQCRLSLHERSVPSGKRSDSSGVYRTGPEGMRIAKDGKLVWDIPAEFPESYVDVLLSVSDKVEQETFHTFKLAVVH